MFVLTRSEYQKILENITTFPYTYPSLEIQDELDNYPGLYIGWAIWCVYGLPKPKNEKDKASLEMVINFLNKNLKVVDDNEIDRLELIQW